MNDTAAERFPRMISQGRMNAKMVKNRLKHGDVEGAIYIMRFLRNDIKLAEQDLEILKRREARK